MHVQPVHRKSTHASKADSMNELLEFAGRHPYLVAAAVFLLLLIIIHEFRQARGAAKSLGPTSAVPLMNRGAQLVDVRSVEAFRKGHIINAKNIPAADMADKLDRLEKSTPVIVCCDAGLSSSRVAAQLRREGFEEVYSLAGGIGAWQRENMPLVAGDK